MHKTATIIANFGGPRNLEEIAPFLKALLCDQDVVRTPLPRPLHRFLFRNIATFRSGKVAECYKKIGGKSPIFADTEALRDILEPHLDGPVLTFHRYLPATHDDFLRSVGALRSVEIRLFPMFPQFSHATTGSIGRWFLDHFSPTIVEKMQWIKSYPTHPDFIEAHKKNILRYLNTHHIAEQNALLLFSAHGIPKKFIDEGDIYQQECEATFRSISKAFPGAKSILCYQSKFSPGAWLKPYTSKICQNIRRHSAERSEVVIIPMSFTSDHFETLFEIEYDYMPIIRQQGLKPYRIPALRFDSDWVRAICSILKNGPFCPTASLVRNERSGLRSFFFL